MTLGNINDCGNVLHSQTSSSNYCDRDQHRLMMVNENWAGVLEAMCAPVDAWSGGDDHDVWWSGAYRVIIHYRL